MSYAFAFCERTCFHIDIYVTRLATLLTAQLQDSIISVSNQASAMTLFASASSGRGRLLEPMIGTTEQRWCDGIETAMIPQAHSHAGTPV